MKKLDIKGIIFDYGGTLDTRGDHWSEVIWQGYEHFGIGVSDDEEVEAGVSIDKASYRLAYVYGERALAVNPIVKPDFHFVDILREKIALQLAFLSGKCLLPTGKDDEDRQASIAHFLTFDEPTMKSVAKDMADYINTQTNLLLAENKQVLEQLKAKGYPMVLVSNFYGNIHQVLRDAQIEDEFKSVIESAVVGVRKPNPAIFALGVCALDLAASQVLVVGDTFSKDIEPAHQLGCHTLWIKGLQWEEKAFDESIPDGIIHRLGEMIDYL
ncbi:MAG TPA: HAD family hydrolase [Prevotella sp.]|nr:HAD family hydrolase [uncultured Prevotella sp.]HBF05104.1 HAD family hydrolase [Candidatus Segatella violae]